MMKYQSIKTVRSVALSLLALSVMAVSALAKPLTLKVTPGQPNLITFTSIAPLETIVGKTSSVRGALVFDPDNLAAPVSGSIEVDMATLDTDNRVRDGHMRSNHLHTDQFPFSRFTLQSLTDTGGQLKFDNGKQARFKARGSFLCHGVTHDIQPEVKAVWNATAGELEVEAFFSVKLSDYNIPRPQFLVMKLDEMQAIAIKFTARP